MADIVDDLQKAIDGGLRKRDGTPIVGGSADSDVNVLVRTVPLQTLERAITEIRELRAKVMLVQNMADFKEIKPNG